MIKTKLILLLTISVVFLGCKTTTDSKKVDGSDNNDDEETSEEVNIPDSTDTENLIVVTLDGVRWQEVFTGADSALINNNGYIYGSKEEIKERFWADNEKERRKKLMPFFWNELDNEGQLYGNRYFNNSVDMTNSSLKSIPGYSELWTGYADPLIYTNNGPPNPHINVLEYLKKQTGFNREEVQAIVPTEGFVRVLNVERSNLLVHNVKNDHKTIFDKTMEVLEDDQPRVVYMAIVDTDHWAHEYRYDTYLSIIHKADSYIKEIWDFVQQDDFYKNNTTLLVTTDHGRGIGSEWHTHGADGGVDHAEEIWFAITGPDTEPSGEQTEKTNIEAIQFAKTIAALLELHFDTGSAEGSPIESVMDR